MNPNQSIAKNYLGQDVTAVLPANESQVSHQFSLIRHEIRDNADIIARLRERLSSVLVGSAMECGKAGASPEEILVPLADQMRREFKFLRDQNIELLEIVAAIQL